MKRRKMQPMLLWALCSESGKAMDNLLFYTRKAARAAVLSYKDKNELWCVTRVVRVRVTEAP